MNTASSNKSVFLKDTGKMAKYNKQYKAFSNKELQIDEINKVINDQYQNEIKGVIKKNYAISTNKDINNSFNHNNHNIKTMSNTSMIKVKVKDDSYNNTLTCSGKRDNEEKKNGDCNIF